MASTINGTSTGNGGLISTGDDSGILNIQTNETTAITVDASQRIGIGTTSPSNILDIVSASNPTIRITDTTNNCYTELNATDTVGYVGTASNHAFAFTTNNTERMRIDSSGNLLVGFSGRTSIYDQNTVNGVMATPGTSSAIQVATDPNGSTGNACILLNMRNTPINGAKYLRTFYNGTTETGSISLNGSTGVLYNLTSDYRLKNNPVPVTGAKDFVMALQPKTWDWWDNSGKGVGFIAHEFMEVAKYSGNGEKDAVDADGKPVYQSIQPSSSEVIANMVALMQEQQTTINALTARVVALESK